LGVGTLGLTGANTYTGGTTISAGTLQVGAGGTTGSIVGNVVDNAKLAFDRSNSVTFAGVVSGTGSLTQLGVGTLGLTGANTYTGGTTISAGTLQLANAKAAGSGDISFASASGEIEYAVAGANLGNTIAGFRGTDEIDFSTIAYATGDKAVDAAGKVTIETSTDSPITTFKVSGTYASDNFNVGKDASDHVLVTYLATPQSAALAVTAGSSSELLGQPGSGYALPSTPAGDGFAFDSWALLAESHGIDPSAFDFRHDGNVGGMSHARIASALDVRLDQEPQIDHGGRRS
jgi:autotransporter-associated beta strand protein